MSHSPGATWPNHMRRRVPFARIDYVLTGGALSASSAQVLADSGSDHLAVTAELRLP